MQGIFQKENTDKVLKYGIYRHLPTYEKIIRNLVSFYTSKTMFFLTAGSRPLDLDFDRTNRLLECRENAYFYNQDNYELLPDDFKIEIGYEGNPLKDLFLKMETILSACLLASNSFIQDGKLKLQIMGQRSMEYHDTLENIQGNNNLYKIYNWIYSGGSIVDKVIIARNIICLHCKYESLLNISDGVMASIQTNYNLYLRDNVTQYLELKNKVAEFITDIVSRTGEYATEMLDKFKTNLLAILGFLFSVILANIVSDQPLDNIFTKDITILSEIVLIASFGYLFISYQQSKYELQKVYSSYDKLKDSYREILTEDDIRECFQNDDIKTEMKRTIDRSVRIYLIIWGGILLSLLILVEYMSSEPFIWPILKSLFQITKK